VSRRRVRLWSFFFCFRFVNFDRFFGRVGSEVYGLAPTSPLWKCEVCGSWFTPDSFAGFADPVRLLKIFGSGVGEQTVRSRFFRVPQEHTLDHLKPRRQHTRGPEEPRDSSSVPALQSAHPHLETGAVIDNVVARGFQLWIQVPQNLMIR